MPDTPAPLPVSPQAEGSRPAGTNPADALVQLGQRIASARQAQGLSIETLANRLRLGTDQLEALEHADPSRLPEPVFVIAQARRVAASLGLNVDDDLAALRSYATPRAATVVSPLPAAGQPSRPGSSSFPVVPAALVLGSLALAGALVGAALLVPRPSPRPSTAAITPSGSMAPAPAAAGSSPGPAAATAATSATADLVLHTTGPSWIEVRDAAGRSLFQGTLGPGEKRFPLGAGLRVMAGRPDLVSASVAGGPPRVLGPISAVQWRGFSRSSPDPIPVAPGAMNAPVPGAISPPGAPAP